MDKKIIVEIHSKRDGYLCDFEIPLYITAMELLQALNQSMNLGIRMTHVSECYLTAENPIALLRGNVELSEYGLHDGSRIYF